MANYIQALQETVSIQATKLDRLNAWRNRFRRHLLGSKFQGVESDGSRKDWIATNDVLAWLESMPLPFELELIDETD